MDTASTQCFQIIDYCRKNGFITTRQAVVHLNIMSPTKRISEIRRMGYTVDIIKVTGINKNGNKYRYFKYFISEE